MSGDPTDIRHAPVDILGMNVLIVPGGSGDVCQIATSPMLTSLRLACRTTRVHQEEGRLCIHRKWIDSDPRELLQQLVHEVVATRYHGLRRKVLSVMAPPHKDLLNLRALLLRDLKSDIRVRLVFDKLSVAIVSIHVDH